MQSMSLNAAAIFLGAAAGEPAAAWLREALTDIEKERPTITSFERAWAAAGLSRSGSSWSLAPASGLVGYRMLESDKTEDAGGGGSRQQLT